MKYWQGAPREGVNPSLPKFGYYIRFYKAHARYEYYVITAYAEDKITYL
jgi:hypothetical protein